MPHVTIYPHSACLMSPYPSLQYISHLPYPPPRAFSACLTADASLTIDVAAFAPKGTWLGDAAARCVRLGYRPHVECRGGMETLPRGLVLSGHTSDVTGLAFSPDGSILATSSLDGSVRVAEADTGDVRAVARRGRGAVG